MSAKKTETKIENEREYIIPLRRQWKKVPRYKRANKAIKAIKEFLVRHFKIRDRDLNKVKIDKYLNESIWLRGIKRPPNKIKVRAKKESGSENIIVELSELPEKLKFKKLREEKREKKAKETKEKKKPEKEEDKEGIKKSEEKTEEEEKKSAVVEAGKELEKAAAKKAKHEAKAKTKQPKRQFRQALKK